MRDWPVRPKSTRQLKHLVTIAFECAPAGVAQPDLLGESARLFGTSCSEQSPTGMARGAPRVGNFRNQDTSGSDWSFEEREGYLR